jgi:hypothetical protein
LCKSNSGLLVSVLLIHLTILSWMLYYLEFWTFIVHLEIRLYQSSKLILLLLYCTGWLSLHISFRISLPIPTKYLVEIVLTPWITLRGTENFTMWVFLPMNVEYFFTSFVLWFLSPEVCSFPHMDHVCA